jgi:hypothetical protein
MLTALAFMALAGAVAMLLCVRRENRPTEDDAFVQLAQSRQFVLTPPPPPRRRPERSAGAVAPLADEELVRLEEWRRAQLVAAGLAADAAEAAARAGVDAGSFRSLVARGCPPELALKILL